MKRMCQELKKFSFSAILSDYVTGGQYYPGTSEYEGISESLADYKKRIINQEKTAENSGATISFKEFELEYEGTYTFKVSEKPERAIMFMTILFIQQLFKLKKK